MQALAFTFLKGYQWPFDSSKVPGSSQVDILVKRENDLGRRMYLDYLHNPRGWSLEALSPEARAYPEKSGGGAGNAPRRAYGISGGKPPGTCPALAGTGFVV